MPITVIRTAPDTSAYTSLAEFQAQTPESLEDPEVLHYSSPVDCVFIPPITSPFQSSSVVTYVTSKSFILWSESESKGFVIPYPNISLHAAQAPGSRGDHSRGCIYMQLEGASRLTIESGANGHEHPLTGEEEEEEEEEDRCELVEVRLIPADESTLNAFYEGLCACASLHPDIPSAMEDDFEGGELWMTDDFAHANDDIGEDGNVSKWRRTD